jgi:hypothetical protein
MILRAAVRRDNAGANLLDPHTRQAEDEPVGPRIAGRHVAVHRKAEPGGEGLGRLLDRPAQAPSTAAMHEGPCAGSTDHRMIDRRFEPNALNEVGATRP